MVEVSVIVASMISSLTVLATSGLHSNMLPMWYYLLSLWSKKKATCSVCHHINECQWYVNDCWSCIIDYSWAVQSHWAKIQLLAACLSKNARTDISTISLKYMSMEHQQFFVQHLGIYQGFATTSTHGQSICYLSKEQCYQWHRYCPLKMYINGPSMNFGHASWIIQQLCHDIDT